MVELERKKLLQARLMAIKLADAKMDLHKSLPAPLAVLDGKRLLFWKGLLPASRSATNSSLSVSKLHCQDCQRGRPTTGGPYMLISLLTGRIVPVSLSLKKTKKEGQEAIAHQTRSPQGKKKTEKRGQHGRPMTGLSYRAMRAA